MARPAHGRGRIGRHDLAEHHPIEQVTQRGQAQLRGRRGSRALQLLDVGGDMHALDRRELRDALRLKPVEEFRRRARIGATRVRIPDLGCEEFEEAIGGARTDGGNKGGRVEFDCGNKLFSLQCIVGVNRQPSRLELLRELGLPSAGGIHLRVDDSVEV